MDDEELKSGGEGSSCVIPSLFLLHEYAINLIQLNMKQFLVVTLIF